jgi:hypothetical protein
MPGEHEPRPPDARISGQARALRDRAVCETGCVRNETAWRTHLGFARPPLSVGRSSEYPNDILMTTGAGGQAGFRLTGAVPVNFNLGSSRDRATPALVRKGTASQLFRGHQDDDPGNQWDGKEELEPSFSIAMERINESMKFDTSVQLSQTWH